MPSDLELCLGGDDAACARLSGDTSASGSASLIGQDLYNSDRTYAGRLQQAPAPSSGHQVLEPGLRLVDPETGRAVRFTGGTYLTDAGGGKAYNFLLDPSGGVVKSSILSASDLGGGGSAPAYSSTRQARLDAEAFERERDATQFARQKELDRIRAENDKLMQARSDLRALAEAGSTLYAQTQNILADTLGRDVVRGAIRGTGGVTRGVTPMAGYRTGVAQTGQQAQGVAQQATGALGRPAANAAATEGLVGQLEGQLPTLPGAGSPFTGMAGGGVIDMSQGEDGSYGMTSAGGMHQMPDGQMMSDAEMQGGPGQQVQMGTQKQAYLLGEGATQVEPGTEVGIVDPAAGTMEVIPLGGGAAEGGTFGFDPSTVQQALGPVYESLGFSKAPMFTRTRRQPMGLQVSGGLGSLERLGVKPQLVSNAVTGAVYRVENGTLRPITGRGVFAGYGYQPQDVVRLSPQDLASLGDVGKPLPHTPGSVIEPGSSQRRFPPSGSPQYITEGPVGLRGLGIPAVRTIAALLRPGSNLSAQTRDVLMSALRLVGYTPEEIEAERAYFTPSGTARASGAALLA